MMERELLLALNAAPGIKRRALVQAVAAHDGAVRLRRAWEAGGRTGDPVLDEALAALKSFDVDGFLKEERGLLSALGADFVTCAEEGYPKLLREIPDPPMVLYVRGRLFSGQGDFGVAVVGSRRASLYGVETAERLSGRLAELGLTVVSGMARGIDTAAHRGALRGNGRTVAVLGCGLARCYPPENRPLMERIAAHGAVLSEFPLRTPPLPAHFPRRNRIISGLSWGVVVVEAARRSGALVTSRCALEQGREVFAVPGPIGRPQSEGTHRLIREGARLITCVEDILEELSPHLGRFTGREASMDETSDPKGGRIPGAETILAQIGTDPIVFDDLIRRCDTPVPEAGRILLQLELAGAVRQLPGQFYVRA